ncbi:CRISPR-associated endonuclease Cas1 [Microcoleus sp. LAD1_D5]|uniref:CRISPR-associated endonuclease Cas1 n=1 Tax=Microcoleus sp. LAD1_D5 TaxID=2818813 RepID=UPI002FD09E4B
MNLSKILDLDLVLSSFVMIAPQFDRSTIYHLLDRCEIFTDLCFVALEENIPVIFLSQLGEYKGQLWNAENRSMTIELAQFDRRQDEFFRLQMARAVVQGKLYNSKLLLLRLNRKRRLETIQAAINGLSTDLEALENAENIAEILGYEGCGAARYFPALGQAITSEGFELTERVFHPPNNPMNALLSFGYTQLLNNVFSLLLAEGVNPYLGNLHGTDDQRADLAFDLMEEFRSPIVDTLVMKLVNQKIIKPTDFSWYKENGGIYLTNTARRIFLKYFEERISELVTHSDIQTQVSYRRAIQFQIRRYKQYLVNDAFIYEPWLRRQ